MASGSLNMTTYIAKKIIGSNTAQDPGGALLQSGAGRADNSTTGDTWIFLDSIGGTTNYWGFKHDQANNAIRFYGGGTLRSTIWLGESKITATTFAGNASTATTLATSRKIWGQSFNGSADISGNLSGVGGSLYGGTDVTTLQFLTSGGGALNGKFGRIGLNSTYANADLTNYVLHVTGASYINGLLTIAGTSATHKGIKIGNTYINAISGELIFQNNTAIRFGTDDWDYNKWAGLKYNATNKIIYLGLADNNIFTANSAQSGGSLYFPGIDKVVLTKNTGGIYKYYDTASTAPTIQVNSNNLDVSIIKIDGDNPTDIRDSQAYGFNLKYMGTGSGAGNTLRLIADNSGGTDVTAMEWSGDGKVGIGTTYNTNYRLYVNGTSYLNGATTIAGNLLPEANNTRNIGSSSVKWANVYATTFTGNLTGNVTGNCSGSSGSCTGNAASATTASYLQTPNLSGFSTDQYGNFIHQRTTDSDAWHVCKNDGDAALSVKWETRAVIVYGDLTVGRREVTSGPSSVTYSNRIIINPYYHTGGPWYIKSGDNGMDAYLALYYGNTQLMRIKHNGKQQISWDGDCAGNAATATQLKTACYLSIGNTSRPFDGSVDRTWSMDDIMGSSDSSKFYRGDKTWSDTISGGTLKITNNSNTVTIGSANTSYCYIQNSANIPFYFNKSVYVNGDVYYYNTKVHMSSSGFHPPKNGGIYWDPYVESSSDASDVTSIYQIASGVAGGTELRINQQNDSTDVINICSPYYIYMNSKRIFTINDSWFRINENSGFSSGVYFGGGTGGVVRTDNQFQVGDSGNKFYANSSGNGYFSNHLYIGNYNNTSFALSTPSFICNSWVRTNGSSGWYNQDYGGGWYMTDAKWIRSYNSKPVLIDIGTNNDYGLGTHRLALGLAGGSHVSLMMKGGDVMYGFCVNGNGNWYFGKRTSKSFESTSGDAYCYYGSNTFISPYSDNTVSLGDSSHRWKECRAVNFYGALTGNVTGNCSGSSGSCTGNAATATTATNLSGGTISLKANQYTFMAGAMNCNNSNIVGVNGLFFSDKSESFGEGICFYRSATTCDSIAAADGFFYFCSNKGDVGLSGTNANAWLNAAVVSLFPGANANYNEGLRIHSSDGTWATIMLCGTDNTGNTGTSANSWGIFNNNGNFYISRNNSSSGPGLRCVSNVWSVANSTNGNSNYTSSAIQIREYNHGGSQTDSWANAPRLGFHWSGRNAAQIGCASNGYLYECPGTGTNFYRLTYEGGTWSMDITGNAATATTASAANVLNINNTMSLSNCLQYIQTSSQTSNSDLPTSAWWHCIKMNHGNGGTYYKRVLAFNFWGQADIRTSTAEGDGVTKAWKRVWCEGNSVTSAVWNDYAECRETQAGAPGQCVYELGDDTLAPTTERMQPAAGIISDTWGFSQGETETAKTPIAVAGRVLAYTYRCRDEYMPGDVLCAAPGGTVDIMTRDEIREYPDRIVGIVSCIPDYEYWGAGEGSDRKPVEVDGRIWIKVQ